MNLNLAEMAQGAFMEQFNIELKKVLANIADPNTDPKKARKITLTATLKVDENRDVVDFEVQSKASLIPAKPIATKIIIVDHSTVKLISNILNDSDRETYVTAHAFQPQFRFGYFYDTESFIILLQSCFVQNEDALRIFKLVGNIKDSVIRTYGDDGITQSVTAKVGIAQVEEVPVPNPVKLAPYRTFVEVEQPESKFVFRMRKGEDGPEAALFEADGGAWKIEAMQRIKIFLEEKLEDSGIKVIA